MTTNSYSTYIDSNSLFLPLQQSLGASVVKSVLQSKILLIGAGGIGCELLKNLALSGFRYVDVIDLDTIDVSNLNRQFLFRSHHVGKSKCEVACNAAKQMAIAINTETDENMEDVKYIPHHGNVKDKQRFGLQFFKKFDVVLNALDNVDARRHVNRLCLASGVPLVEAGTTGYLGQVTVIHKESSTECYECQPKPTQKVYPICTIRSTPSMPVHTIVWAKELYKLMFGSKPENSMLFEDDTINDNPNDNSEIQKDGNNGEKSVYMDIILNKRPDIKSDESKPTISQIHKYAHDIIVALYHSEIQKQLDMDRYKTASKTPIPLPSELIHKTIYSDGATSGKPILSPSRSKDKNVNKSTHIWSPTESLSEFIACLEDVYLASLPVYDEFDKDDSLAMRFVTAASNLRSHVFQISPLQSIYSAKGIAGNIIPAIATTNAIVAGLQILNVFKILSLQQKQSTNEKGINVKESCKYTYCLREKTRKGYYIQPTSLPPPNPNCFVCRGAKVDITLNCSNWTLQDFVEKIIKKRLGFVEPTILIGDDGGDIIHEEGEGADVQSYIVNWKKSLVNLPAGGIHGKVGDMVRVEDFFQNLEVDVCVWHREEWDEEKESDGFVIGGEAALKLKKSKDDKKNGEVESKKPVVNDNGNNDDDDDIICVNQDEIKFSQSINSPMSNIDNKKKRSRPFDDDSENKPDKKIKVNNNCNNDSTSQDNDDIVVIE